MSNLGPIHQDDEHYSPGRMNAKNITRDTGTNIVALATTKQLGAVCPTDTSAGLIKNVLYIVDYDSSFNRIGFIPVYGKHLHDSNTDAAGGRYIDIRHANSGNYFQLDIYPENINPWLTNATNGTLTRDATTTADDAYLLFSTLGATNNHITGTLLGPKLKWSENLLAQWNSDVSLNSNILTRIGVGIDRVDEAQSTSRRQMGLEGCDGHGTSWVIINANGNASSLTVTATTMPLNAAAEKNYKLFHIPATEVRAYYDGVSNAVSNTNVASTGETDHLRLFRCGIKLPTGTTAKTIKFWHGQIMAVPGSDQFN